MKIVLFDPLSYQKDRNILPVGLTYQTEAL